MSNPVFHLLNGDDTCAFFLLEHRNPNVSARLDMTANRHQYFRWTPRTAGITFMYVVVVPSAFGVLAYTTDVSVYSVIRPKINGGVHWY